MFGAEGQNAGPFGGGSPFDAGAFGLNDLFDAFFGGGGGGAGAVRPARRAAPTRRRCSISRSSTSCSARARPSTCRCPSSANGARAPGVRPVRIPTAARRARAAARCARCGVRCSVRSSPPARATRAARPARSSRTRATRAAAPGGSTARRTIEVDVPRGIDDGQQLRLAGRGPAAPRGGPAGDLYVAVRVARALRARTARRRALVPAADLDRAGRARHADRDHDARR